MSETMPQLVSGDTILGKMLNELDKNLESSFEELLLTAPPVLRSYVEVARDFVLNAGKRLRPTVLLISYLGYGGKLTDNALLLSAIIELMHNFLLIHDDVIDNSELRRGKPTVHKIYERTVNDEKLGKDLAIVVGDILAFYAFGLLSKLDLTADAYKIVLRFFSECYVLTGYGQMLDILFSGRIRKEMLDSTVPEDISRLKTAYYTFVQPLVLGYTLAGGTDSGEISKLEDVGKCLGMAFQYQDDLFGVFGGERKSINDITEGKFTPLLKTAFTLSQDPVESERVLSILSKRQKTEEDEATVRAFIESSGAIEWLKSEIERFWNEALEGIGKLSMNDEYKSKFIDVLKTTLRR